MNYIDPTLTTSQLIVINTRAENFGDSIAWRLTKEGNSTPEIIFSTPSTEAVLVDFSYYQELAVDLHDLGVTLEDETMYILKGTVGSETMYLGKVYSTSKDIQNYSVNEGKYTSSTDNNNFTILD